MNLLIILLEVLDVTIKEEKYLAYINIIENIVDIIQLLNAEVNFFALLLINFKIAIVAWDLKKILSKKISQ